MIDGTAILNGVGFGLLASTCLIAGFSLWDHNGRRKLAGAWWLFAAVYYLMGAAALVHAAVGHSQFETWLERVQWLRTGGFGGLIYWTVIVRRREQRAATTKMIDLAEVYGNGKSVRSMLERVS